MKRAYGRGSVWARYWICIKPKGMGKGEAFGRGIGYESIYSLRKSYYAECRRDTTNGANKVFSINAVYSCIGHTLVFWSLHEVYKGEAWLQEIAILMLGEEGGWLGLFPPFPFSLLVVVNKGRGKKRKGRVFSVKIPVYQYLEGNCS